MKKVPVVIAVLLMLFMAGCSDKKTAAAPPQLVLGTLITSPSVSPITNFMMTLASHDTGTLNGSFDIFPGVANVWDINPDFSLEDGNDDQWDGAMLLTVGTGSDFSLSNQVYSELSFYTPAAGSGTGLQAAVVSDGASAYVTAYTGTYSAYISPTSDSRLSQTVVLTAATGSVTFSWNEDVSIDAPLWWVPIAGYTPKFRVVVRDTAGTELQEIYTISANALGLQTADLTAYAGQTIVLSFELGSRPYAWAISGAVIDDVSVLDGGAAQFVTNGTFETGTLSGWTTNTATLASVQNMTSGSRNLAGLDVTRSFYTMPDKLWGRWVDVFTNNTVTSITTTVTYGSNLGNDSCGVIYDTPGAAGKAVTSWDTTLDDRDVAMVFGLVSSATYSSTSVLSPDWIVTCDGLDQITHTFVVTVPAGGSVALVNFIVMGTYDTGLTATDTTARATEVDAAAAAIANNFWTDPQYRNGMTQAQINAVANF